MSGKDRFPSFPSRMQLQVFKNRKKGAVKGHSLLKRKSDALKARLNAVVKEIYAVKLQMNDVMRAAHFSHTEARHAAGDFNGKVISKAETASCRIALFRENVVGVAILQFAKSGGVMGASGPINSGNSSSAIKDKQNNNASDAAKGASNASNASKSSSSLSNMTHASLLGLSRGGSQIRKCTEKFDIALELLIRLASLQSSFRELDDAMRVTNRRVQALENVVIPKIDNTIAYISSELDEREREDLFRLKKVVQKKKAEEAIARAQRKALEAKQGMDTRGPAPVRTAFDDYSGGAGGGSKGKQAEDDDDVTGML